MWSSGQSSWLQIQRSGFDSRLYQISWEVVGLERSPLSLVSRTEKLSERNSNGYGLEIREYSRRDPSRWPRGTLYLQKLALTLLTSGGSLVGTVRSRTQATEFNLVLLHVNVRTTRSPFVSFFCDVIRPFLYLLAAPSSQICDPYAGLSCCNPGSFLLVSCLSSVPLNDLNSLIPFVFLLFHRIHGFPQASHHWISFPGALKARGKETTRKTKT
jgi:hypothetical protein